jgi:hypothetical protein
MDNTTRRFLEVLMDEEIVSEVLHEMANAASRLAANCRIIGGKESKAAAEGWVLAATTIREAAEKLES